MNEKRTSSTSKEESFKETPSLKETQWELMPVFDQESAASEHGRETSEGFGPGEAWLRIEAFIRQKAERTKVTYRSVLNEFCLFNGITPNAREEGPKLLRITERNVFAYREWLTIQEGQQPRISTIHQDDFSNAAIAPVHYYGRSFGKIRDGTQSSLADATIRKKLVILRRLFRVLCNSSLGLNRNPFDHEDIDVPRSEGVMKRPTEMIPFEDVEQLLAAPPDDTPKGIRDRALLALLLGGGLRRSEVINLRLGDIRKSPQNTPYLYLRATKGQRDATQALPEWAWNRVRQLISQRQREGAVEGSFLIIAYTGRGGKKATPKPISETSLYTTFKQYCALAGLNNHLSPHSARATAISKLLSDGIGHREVQHFSRHKSVAMVELYDKRRFLIEENPGRTLSFATKKKVE